jgi:molybdate transport system substrate-binding protein
MKAGTVLCLAALLCGALVVPAQAGELRVITLGSAAPVLLDLSAGYERATGTRLVVLKGTSGETRNRILGEAGDVGIINAPLLAELEPKGRIVAGTATVFAKTEAGVAVRAGSVLDVGSLDKLKAALRGAASIATVDPAGGSALGKHIQGVAESLGIGDEFQRKRKVYKIGVAVGEAVGRGEAEIGIGFIPEFNAVPNVAVAGPLPGTADFSSHTTAVILAGSQQTEAARALIAFLRSPAAQQAIRPRGMSPL